MRSCLNWKWKASVDVVIMEVNDKMTKTKDLSNFERGMIVGARGGDASEMMTVLGYSYPKVSWIFRE